MRWGGEGRAKLPGLPLSPSLLSSGPKLTRGCVLRSKFLFQHLMPVYCVTLGKLLHLFCAFQICAIGTKAFRGQSFQVRPEKPTESCTDVLYSGTHLGALTFAKMVKHHSGAAAPSTGLNSLLNRGSAGPDRKQGASSSAWSARKSAPLSLL